MKKPIEFLSEAEAEYLSALAWYRKRSHAAALKFEAEFRRAVETIGKNPERWAHPILRAADSPYFISTPSQLSIRALQISFRCWPLPIAIDGQVIGKAGSEYRFRAKRRSPML